MAGPSDGYSLLDAGAGRRLERVGPWLLDRPAPAAVDPRRAPGRWRDAVYFEPVAGWHRPDGSPATEPPAAIEVDGLRLEVRLADGGQIGLFPEHREAATWLAEAVARRGPGAAVLNLFAHTGLATLAAARAGGAIAHVDASRPAVAWARRNAELADLADRPIRWLVDDALAFARREGRRGRRYDVIALDPPSYGHGGRGHPAWRFDDDIDGLLAGCAEIATPEAAWLLSTHTPGWDPDRLADLLGEVGGRGIEASAAVLVAESGARLALGAVARFDPLARERR